MTGRRELISNRHCKPRRGAAIHRDAANSAMDCSTSLVMTGEWNGGGCAGASHHAINVPVMFFYLAPASDSVVLCGMDSTGPHIRPARDAAADLQAVLLGLRSAVRGWGLSAVLGWLLAPWIGPRIDRWLAHIATNIERVFAMLRAEQLREGRHCAADMPVRAVAAAFRVVSPQPTRRPPPSRRIAAAVVTAMTAATRVRSGLLSWNMPQRSLCRGAQSACRAMFALASADAFGKWGWAAAQTRDSIVPAYH